MWNTLSGFCFVTFVEHTAAVSGVAFTQSGKAILSSSLDGTVRAFDLTRSVRAAGPRALEMGLVFGEDR